MAARHDALLNGDRSPALPNHTGLPDRLKAGAEARSGLSLDDVRVHYGSAKPAAIGAHAFAQGSQIHLGPGAQRHLPHETWHVVQQKQGRVAATARFAGLGVNTDQRLEREADMVGAQLLRGSDARTPLRIILSATGAAAPVQGVFADLTDQQIEEIKSTLRAEDKREYRRALEAFNRQLAPRMAPIKLAAWLDENRMSAGPTERVRALARKWDLRATLMRARTARRAALEKRRAGQAGSAKTSSSSISPSASPAAATSGPVGLHKLRGQSEPKIAQALFGDRKVPFDDEAVAAMIHEIFAIWLTVGPDVALPLSKPDKIELAALLMAHGRLRDRQLSIANYFLGLRDTMPTMMFGIGTLTLQGAKGRSVRGISGRPGLFGIAPGRPDQARRHIVAWHTLSALINVIVARLKAPSIVKLIDHIRPHVAASVAAAADAIAAKVANDPKGGPNIVWLAIALNNNPHNLWLGSASENISINTLATNLKKWRDICLLGGGTFANFVALLNQAGVHSKKSRDVLAALINSCATVQPKVAKSDTAKQRAAKEEQAKEAALPFVAAALRTLEIDVKSGGRSDTQNDIYDMASLAIPATLASLKTALAAFFATAQSSGSAAAMSDGSGDSDDEKKKPVSDAKKAAK